MDLGFVLGEKCNREGCDGLIEEHASEGGCCCHIHPPCSYCVDDRHYCPQCGWDGLEEQKSRPAPFSDHLPEVKHKTSDEIFSEMDNSKIDFISLSHTHFSMIKKGKFPIGTNREDVREKVNGTFGGRFTRFDEINGVFEFVAYTD